MTTTTTTTALIDRLRRAGFGMLPLANSTGRDDGLLFFRLTPECVDIVEAWVDGRHAVVCACLRAETWLNRFTPRWRCAAMSAPSPAWLTTCCDPTPATRSPGRGRSTTATASWPGRLTHRARTHCRPHDTDQPPPTST